MEKININEERVLAYQLSEEISHEDLDEVSGGNMKMTQRTVIQPTGYYPGPTDVEAKVVVDW